MQNRFEGDEAPDKQEGMTEIQAEIEQTRVEMGGTIDAIQQRLNPDTLAEQARERAQEVVDQARDAVREATIGRAERAMSDAGETATGVRMSIIETIKHNPIPASLAALSLGWLWKNRARVEASSYGYAYRPQESTYFGSADPPYGSPQRYAAGQAYGSGRGYGSPEQGSSGMGQMTERVGEKIGQTASDFASTAGHAASTAGHAAGAAGGTAADVGSELMETIGRNPLPAALTGIGLAWLWMNRPSHDDRPAYARSGSHTWSGSEFYYGERYGDGDGQSVAGQAQQAVGHIAGQVQDTAGQVVGQVQGAASQTAERVSDTASQVVGGAQHQARRAGGRMQSLMDDNPLMVGTLAAAAGLAVGLATPSTERENQMMGEAREQVVQRVQEGAQEAMHKVQQVASDAADAAKSSADEQKLTV
jgi:hypothetical protein